MFRPLEMLLRLPSLRRAPQLVFTQISISEDSPVIRFMFRLVDEDPRLSPTWLTLLQAMALQLLNAPYRPVCRQGLSGTLRVTNCFPRWVLRWLA